VRIQGSNPQIRYPAVTQCHLPLPKFPDDLLRRKRLSAHPFTFISNWGQVSPKQNGHTERVIGTLMADWLCLEEWDTFAEGHVLVTRAIREYNEEHPQSALAFLSPELFESNLV
jgi:transposase InsO family protein